MKFILNKLKQKYSIRNYRFSLAAFVIILSVIGIFIVNSASPDLTGRQIMGVCLGIAAMVIISLVDYRWILNLYWPLYILNLILLLAVPFTPLGVESHNARRWLFIGVTQIQPSDLTKILMILFFARFFMDKEQKMKDPKTIVQAIALILPSLILIHQQPNLSTTLCIAALFCVLLYLAGLSNRVVGTILAVTIPVGVLFLVYAVQPDQKMLLPYQQTRILAWLDPEEYATAESYQQLYSLRAIGSGQLSGKGYNNDDPTSVKNGNFLSESQTDFIFAIIGEELGFVGCCAVIFLILLIVIDCILVGMKAGDTGGRLICGGVAALIGIQSFINIGVATLILPNTGLSLPFVSYGLTSVVCFFMGIGFVLNVGLQAKKYQ